MFSFASIAKTLFKGNAKRTFVTASPDRLRDYGIYLTACLPKYIQHWSLWKDELCLHVAPSALVPVMRFLRDHHACRFSQVTDITAVDYPDRPKRFELVYHLLSYTYGSRLRVKTYADDLHQSSVPSITHIYAGANWYEREVWDMFGVMFEGHTDLRRILTDYAFEGHPMRKDFPLSGFTEVRWDEVKKRIVYEPIEFSQEMRRYDLLSPWRQVPAPEVKHAISTLPAASTTSDKSQP